MAKEEADEHGLTDQMADYGVVEMQDAVTDSQLVSEQLAENTMQISQDTGFRFSENKTIQHRYTFFSIHLIFQDVIIGVFFGNV